MSCSLTAPATATALVVPTFVIALLGLVVWQTFGGRTSPRDDSKTES